MTQPYINLKYKDWSKNQEIFRWADFVELGCLCCRDNLFSKNDLEMFYKQGKDLAGISLSGHTIDQIETLWHKAIEIITFRSQNPVIAGYYPFKFDEGSIVCDKQHFSKENIIYIFMLISSYGTFLDKSEHQKFTTLFEPLSYEAIKNIFHHKNGYTECCGTSAGTSEKLVDRLEKIAQKLRITLDDGYKKKNANKNAGDEGIDIYSWLNISDSNGGIPMFFAQCACSIDDWKNKQSSINPQRLKNIFNFKPNFDPMAFMVVPFSFRTATGDWESYDDFLGTILIDRDRILSLIDFEDLEQQPIFPKIEAVVLQAIA